MPVANPKPKKAQAKAVASDEPPVKDGKRLWRGVWLDARYAKWQAELYLFWACPTDTVENREKKLRLWKHFVNELWPEPIFYQDAWSDLFFACLCGASDTVEKLTGIRPDDSRKYWRNVCAAGAGSTGKSAKAALWILGNWLVSQQFTLCLLTSTSMKALSERIWADIVLWIGKSRVELRKGYLEVINSDLEIRWNAQDRKGMIVGTAVKSGGDVTEAVDRIKGRHNRRVFVVIDEMTAVPEAIVIACRNLNKGTQEFQLLGMANPREKTDTFGMRCEPINGWGAREPGSTFWQTEYGCVVRFDATNNPGLTDPRLYFYPTQEQLEEDAREKGGVNSSEYWSNVRGDWPPSGISTTVMDEALFDQFRVSEPAIWKGAWEVGAALDPSFEGGDRRAFYPFKFGMFATGIMGVEYLPPIVIGIDASTDVRWIHYAIADKVQQTCEGFAIDGKKCPILPRNFIMDTTGEGGGLFSVLSGRWSPEIRSCEFGGAADKVQIHQDRPVTYYELYANRVTAIWYRLRRYIEGGQVHGLSDPTTRRELTSRDKKMKGGKTMIEPKSEMKKRGLRSPDFADAAALVAEFLFLRGIAPSGSTGGGVIFDAKQWNAFAERTELASSDSDFQDDFAAYGL